jgi:ParB/RepB/Spo0J family partition protein
MTKEEARTTPSVEHDSSVFFIPIELIDEEGEIKNARRKLFGESQLEGGDKIEDLVLSMQKLGQLEPITVKTKGDGRYDLVAGRRRLKACQKLGQTIIRATLAQSGLDRAHLRMMNLAENVHHKRLTPYDLAWYVVDLADTEKLTPQDIQGACGVSESHQSNCRQIFRGLIPELLAVWRDSRFSVRFNDLLDVSRMSPDDQKAWGTAQCYLTAEGQKREDVTAGEEVTRRRRTTKREKRASKSSLESLLKVVLADDSQSKAWRAGAESVIKYLLGGADLPIAAKNPPERNRARPKGGKKGA